jgi:hypothetical protein
MNLVEASRRIERLEEEIEQVKRELTVFERILEVWMKMGIPHFPEPRPSK